MHSVQENRNVKVFATPDNHPARQRAVPTLIVTHTHIFHVNQKFYGKNNELIISVSKEIELTNRCHTNNVEVS